jgi:hypothetical protein
MWLMGSNDMDGFAVMKGKYQSLGMALLSKGIIRQYF